MDFVVPCRAAPHHVGKHLKLPIPHPALQAAAVGRAARQRVLSRFSDEAVAVRLRELLDGAQVG